MPRINITPDEQGQVVSDQQQSRVQERQDQLDEETVAQQENAEETEKALEEGGTTVF